MTRIAELAESISTLLKDRGETVGVSESSSGGLVSAALLAVPGASAYFMGGMV
ncbi:MAG: damage-inducible protein, partial [Chloroflexi bacterium]|nr:damage-inducible protein [Chloroflexota bacterium]